MMTSLALPDRRVFRVDLYPRVTEIGSQQLKTNIFEDGELVPLPDFMTSARRELMLSAVFLAFFVGAIVARSRLIYWS
jgi:hypothetical protein